MRVKGLFIAGIMCMAVVAGVIQALSSPHNKGGAEGENRKEQDEAAGKARSD